MKNQFDEMTKNLAQSVTRRAALKEFGVGLTAMTLACFGLANHLKAQSACLPAGYTCKKDGDCCSGDCVNHPATKRFPQVKICG